MSNGKNSGKKEKLSAKKSNAKHNNATKRTNSQIIGKTIKYMLKVAADTDKKLFLMYAFKFLGDALSEVKVLLLPKLLIDELTFIVSGAPYKEHLRSIVIYVLLTVFGEFLSRFFTGIADSHIGVYAEMFNERITEIISDKSMSMDFEYTEDPEALDKLNNAKEGMDWYSGGVIGVLGCVYSVLYGIFMTITSITIIAFYCPLILPVQILAMGAVTYFNIKNQKINTESFLKLAKSNRIFSYVYYELADFRLGKDIRLYDSADAMCEMSKKYADEQMAVWSNQGLSQYKNNVGSNIANAIRDGFSYFYMGYKALKGFFTLGDFSMCVSAASRLYNSMLQVCENIRQITEKCTYAYRFIDFMEYPDALVKGEGEITGDTHTIEFEHVYFKYPRSEEYVLEDVSIKINPGEHLSIVGLNGAGKTTFIKLLLRLYDVTSGRILIDGVDIKDISEEEHRRIFSVVFQDFKLFAFSLKENIMLEEAINRDKFDIFEQSLKMSGLYDDAVKLSEGFDTTLFKSFDEKGTELSKGQQQKTAISRALYKDAPIVILDEPTAALDPIAEYEIYNKFNDLVGGKSAIYISHRLSSCKFCDRIAVFADKTIKEYGTHSELIKLEDGIYANMFNTQAQYYIENA